MTSALCVKLVNWGSSRTMQVSDSEDRYAPEVTNESVLIQFIQKVSAKPRLARSYLLTLSPSMPDLELTLRFIGEMKERRGGAGAGERGTGL